MERSGRILFISNVKMSAQSFSLFWLKFVRNRIALDLYHVPWCKTPCKQEGNSNLHCVPRTAVVAMSNGGGFPWHSEHFSFLPPPPPAWQRKFWSNILIHFLGFPWHSEHFSFFYPTLPSPPTWAKGVPVKKKINVFFGLPMTFWAFSFLDNPFPSPLLTEGQKLWKQMYFRMRAVKILVL